MWYKPIKPNLISRECEWIANNQPFRSYGHQFIVNCLQCWCWQVMSIINVIINLQTRRTSDRKALVTIVANSEWVRDWKRRGKSGKLKTYGSCKWMDCKLPDRESLDSRPVGADSSARSTRPLHSHTHICDTGCDGRCADRTNSDPLWKNRTSLMSSTYRRFSALKQRLI